MSCKTILSIKNWNYLDIILLDENIHKELNIYKPIFINYNNNPNTVNITEKNINNWINDTNDTLENQKNNYNFNNLNNDGNYNIIIGFRNLLQSNTKNFYNKNLNNIITCQLVDAINKNKNLKISDDNSSS